MTPPDTVITAGPADGSTIATSSATFSFEGTTGDTAVLQCSLDGGAYVDCTSPMTFPALADGAHTVRLRAIDAAGNIDATPATRSFTVETTPVDTAAPDTTITAGPADGSRIATDSATFSFEGTTGDTARMQCSLDSAAFTDCTSPITFHDLADGAHTVEFRAVDAAGNIDATPATRSFTVETTPVVTPTPDNTFRVAKHGKANTSKGTRKVRVVVPGPGTVRLAPVGKAPVKTTATTLTRGGATVLTIEPTKAGKRTLARKLRRARAEGRTFARIRVRVKFLFIPDGGTRNVHKRVYTLKRR